MNVRVRNGGFGQSMCRDYVEERRELIRALANGRKLADLPRISQVCHIFNITLDHCVHVISFLLLVQQPTLLVWGELDQIFPLELAHRLKRF